MQLQLVNVGTKLLGDYASIATRGLMEEIRELAAPLEGKRVLHLSATAFGGGVAEINYTLVPLMRDAGLDVEWRIIQGQDEFFDVTKTIHNALQGDSTGLTEEQREIFLLREVSDLQFNEIAQIVGIPENTVKSRMRYALEKLREALEEYRDLAQAAT